MRLLKRGLTWATRAATRPEKWGAHRSLSSSSFFFLHLIAAISKHRGGYDGSIFAATGRRAIIRFSSATIVGCS